MNRMQLKKLQDSSSLKWNDTQAVHQQAIRRNRWTTHANRGQGRHQRRRGALHLSQRGNLHRRAGGQNAYKTTARTHPPRAQNDSEPETARAIK